MSLAQLVEQFEVTVAEQTDAIWRGDAETDVRVKAAAYLLRYRTAETKAVLEEAARIEGMIPFIASEY